MMKAANRIMMSVLLFAIVGCAGMHQSGFDEIPLQEASLRLLLEDPKFSQFNDNFNEGKFPNYEVTDENGVITEMGIWATKKIEDSKYAVSLSLVKDLFEYEVTFTAELLILDEDGLSLSRAFPSIIMRIPSAEHDRVAKEWLSEENLSSLVKKAEEVGFQRMEPGVEYMSKAPVSVQYIK